MRRRERGGSPKALSADRVSRLPGGTEVRLPGILVWLPERLFAIALPVRCGSDSLLEDRSELLRPSLNPSGASPGGPDGWSPARAGHGAVKWRAMAEGGRRQYA